MKTLTITLTILLLITGVALGAPGATVSVEVRLVRADNKQPLQNSGKVVVWLVPANDTYVDADKSDPHFRMSQKNKQFVPDLLVVPVGSYVDFPNLDPWFHNVFSLFRGKRFDLGLYQAGTEKSVRFDRPGAAYLFCNIHPEMSAVILAVESHWFAVSDATGQISIPNVPPGKYVVHFWHEDASAKSLESLTRTVQIDESRKMGQVTIPIQPGAHHVHKNKYGHDYDKNPLNPNY